LACQRFEVSLSRSSLASFTLAIGLFKLKMEMPGSDCSQQERGFLLRIDRPWQDFAHLNLAALLHRFDGSKYRGPERITPC